MQEAVSRSAAGCIAAILFLACGLTTLVTLLLPAPPTMDRLAVAIIGAVSIFGAVPCWLVPWDRGPRRASLVLVVFALPLISVHYMVGGGDAYGLGVFYVVLAAWLGLAQPRGTFLFIAPLVTLSYSLPLLLLPDQPPWALSSTLYLVAVCGLVSETGAWAIERAALAQQALAESEARLRYLAHHDSLTGLANRAEFVLQLETALGTPERQLDVVDRNVGLLFIDIDDFKCVNDRLGHATGDDLLRHVAVQISSCVRPEDVVARFGGDEFTVLLRRVRSKDEALGVAEHIRQRLRTEPFVSDGSQLLVVASVGLALGTPGDSADAILRQADAAMYRAKELGKRASATIAESGSRIGRSGATRRSVTRSQPHPPSKPRFRKWITPVEPVGRTVMKPPPSRDLIALCHGCTQRAYCLEHRLLPALCPMSLDTRPHHPDCVAEELTTRCWCHITPTQTFDE
ncbi:MAG TPA: GGDEF domain-containing protein [Chloroflexota bacterium]|nr:GGDEF domain-containing protein [Chloroflexota bacterium]